MSKLHELQHDEIVTLLTTIGGIAAEIAQHMGIEAPIPATPGDYGTDQCPRTVNALAMNVHPVGHAAADMPQEHTVPPATDAHTGDPGTCDGRPVNGPQSATQRAALDATADDPATYESPEDAASALAEARHATTVPEVAFPTGPDGSLWWVRGMDFSAPVEGIATLEISPLATSFNTIDGQYEIRRNVDPLTEATRVVAVPLRLLERLYESTAYHRVAAVDAIHQIEQWAVEHGQTGE